MVLPNALNDIRPIVFVDRAGRFQDDVKCLLLRPRVRIEAACPLECGSPPFPQH